MIGRRKPQVLLTDEEAERRIRKILDSETCEAEGWHRGYLVVRCTGCGATHRTEITPRQWRELAHE